MSQQSIPNIPWEDRPMGSLDVVWRYSGNPIIPRDLIPSSNSIFNSAAVPFQGKFAGVFRCDNKKREMNLNRGFSENGIDWMLDNEPIEWLYTDEEIGRYQFRYDPRVVWIEDRYWVTWCNGFVYAFGAALLDLEQPWQVIYRSEPYLLAPQTLYECVGDVPNVAFPCAALYDEPTGRLAIYYGGADTVTALAFCKMDELLAWLRGNSAV